MARKLPAVTIVAACIKADIEVDPFMASSNHHVNYYLSKSYKKLKIKIKWWLHNLNKYHNCKSLESLYKKNLCSCQLS